MIIKGPGEQDSQQIQPAAQPTLKERIASWIGGKKRKVTRNKSASAQKAAAAAQSATESAPAKEVEKRPSISRKRSSDAAKVGGAARRSLSQAEKENELWNMPTRARAKALFQSPQKPVQEPIKKEGSNFTAA